MQYEPRSLSFERLGRTRSGQEGTGAWPVSRAEIVRARTRATLDVTVTTDRDLTGLLRAWSDGDAEALSALTALVHHELREIARRILSEERRADFQPTELIQESYLRLLDWRAVHWQNRKHFFATVARMMRHAIVDAARARRATKRGNGVAPMSLGAVDDVSASVKATDVVALSDALQALATVNPRAGQVVELRFFGGFSVEETAEALSVSPRTVINDWNAARAWLLAELTGT